MDALTHLYHQSLIRRDHFATSTQSPVRRSRRRAGGLRQRLHAARSVLRDLSRDSTIA